MGIYGAPAASSLAHTTPCHWQRLLFGFFQLTRQAPLSGVPAGLSSSVIYCLLSWVTLPINCFHSK